LVCPVVTVTETDMLSFSYTPISGVPGYVLQIDGANMSTNALQFSYAYPPAVYSVLAEGGWNFTDCTASSVTLTAQSDPYVVDFDSNSAHWAAVPSNPLLQQNVPLRVWIVTNQLSLSGVTFADHTSGSGNFLLASDQSINPISFDLAYFQSGSGSITLSFYYFNNPYQVAVIPSQLLVFVLGETEISEVGLTPVWTSGQSLASSWTPVSVDLSSYSGQAVKIRFVANTLGAGGYSDIGVDDVNLQFTSANAISSGAATVVAAIVVSVLFVVIVTIIFCFIIYRRYQWKHREATKKPEESKPPEIAPYIDPSLK